MRKARKGFTLVELLIVVAILGVLAAGLSMSSTDAVDAAGANNILNNLQSVKTAAMQMYMNGVKVDDYATALPKYMGKKSNTDKIGSGKGKYSVVAVDRTDTDPAIWYAVYQLADSDTAGLRVKLKDKATTADLYKSEAGSAFEHGYTNEAYVAVKVLNY